MFPHNSLNTKKNFGNIVYKVKDFEIQYIYGSKLFAQSTYIPSYLPRIIIILYVLDNT